MPPDLSPENQARLNRVTSAHDIADKRVHAGKRKKWEELYKLYRVYQEFKTYTAATPGVDVTAEAHAEWGSDLHIPYSFSNVETIVPRMLSNRPRGFIEPWDAPAVRNAPAMLLTLDAQQVQAKYQLTCQTTAKSGQIYGTGIQKSGWRFVERDAQFLERGVNVEWAVGQERRTVYDDPYAEDVDIFDFLWDPFADSIDNCEWVIHRTWRSLRYVMARLGINPDGSRNPDGPPPDWDLAPGVTVEDLRSYNGAEKYNEVWSGRSDAASERQKASAEQGEIHEVWEFHDGNRVITVLDRCLPVRDIENPSWRGDLPFHVYRPAEIPHEFCGVGAIEPARYLQYEMDLLRSQRRDMASLALTPVYSYQDGMIDPAHLQVRPGALWPVLGEPRDLLHKVQLGDVPQSGYMEEDRIRADIERATGLSDLVMGSASSNDGTATGAQLQLAAANVRIQNMTWRFELEAIESVMNDWLGLNQQHILEARGRPTQIPTPGMPDSRWQWKIEEIGPEELAGQMFWRPRGGSAAPDNIPQMRNDAQTWSSFMGSGVFDDRVLAERIAENMGERHPETLLVPPDFVPPETLDIAMELSEQAGIDPELMHEVLSAALEQAKEPQGQGQEQ